MNVNFQTAEKGGKSATVEWYTPPEFIQALGKFDLDPATCEALGYELKKLRKQAA